jgi:transcriptional regulator with XRE-family HTH domain
MELSQIIKEVRNSRTMKQFATLLSISEASVSRYEKGSRRPSAPVFSRLLELATTEQQAALLSAIKGE